MPTACRSAAGARSNRRRPRKRCEPAAGPGRRRQLRRRRRLPGTVGLPLARADPRLQRRRRRPARDPRPGLRRRPGPDHPHHRLPHPRKLRHLRHGPHRLPAGVAEPLRVPEADQPQPASQLHLPRAARSYLSAACDAPAGFPGASFPFAHASMTFADGRTLASTLTRSCRVAGLGRQRDPRDRPGDDGHDLPRLRCRGAGRRPRLLGVRAALPAARAGSSTTRRKSGR